jgi:hypothetical protein
MVFVVLTMVCVSGTTVPVSESLVWWMKTMVPKPERIFLVARKMVSLVKEIFSFTKAMVSGTETTLCVMIPMFTTTETNWPYVGKKIGVNSLVIRKSSRQVCNEGK